jgi:hypothetical protein
MKGAIGNGGKKILGPQWQKIQLKCSSLVWEAELVSSELGYLVRRISGQALKVWPDSSLVLKV